MLPAADAISLLKITQWAMLNRFSGAIGSLDSIHLSSSVPSPVQIQCGYMLRQTFALISRNYVAASASLYVLRNSQPVLIIGALLFGSAPEASW